VARGQGYWWLVLGAVGVVFGDIGTSPLYALREALAHASKGAGQTAAVLGVVSLVIWALTLIVSVKYVTFLMRADNRGEGGTLALMALAQRALGKPSMVVFFLGMVGASLFFGDGIITPAISVLSAVEGVEGAPLIGHMLAPYVLPLAAGILIALFLVQSRGTDKVASLFGPITVVWFLVLGALGLLHIGDNLSVFRALNPYYGARFIMDNGFLGSFWGAYFSRSPEPRPCTSTWGISEKVPSAPHGWPWCSHAWP
jgi:KUP system potassium uptake protein